MPQKSATPAKATPAKATPAKLDTGFNSKLRKENEELLKNKAELTSEITELEIKQKELKQENLRNEMRIDGISTINEKNTALEAEKTSWEEEKTELQAKITALETEKAELEAKNTVLEADKASWEAKITGLETEKTSLQASWEAKITGLETEKTSLQASWEAEKASWEAEKASLEQEKASLEQEKTSWEEKNTALEAKNTSLRVEEENADKALPVPKDEPIKLDESNPDDDENETYQGLKTENDKLKTEKEELSNKNIECQIIQQTQLIELRKTEGKVKELEEKIRTLSSEHKGVSDIGDIVTKNKEEFEKLTNNIVELKAENVKLKAENDMLEEEKKKLEVKQEPKEANKELIKIIEKYMVKNSITDSEEKARFLDSLSQKIPNKTRGGTLNNNDLYAKLRTSLETKSLVERNIMLAYIEDKIRQKLH